jgi:hypothetical protein
LSDSGAAFPISWDRFREIWSVDFEYQMDDCGRSRPFLMVAKERRSGRVIIMRGPELRACRQAPFNTGEALMTSYSNPAELGCFLDLTWSEPRHCLCTFTETCAAINGLDTIGLEKRRPKLYEAMDLFSLPHSPLSYKMGMRDRILGTPESDFTPQDWQDFEGYCTGDVDDEAAQLTALMPEIDLDAALFRGKFLKVVAHMERRGIPIDAGYLDLLRESWQDLRLHYIRERDRDGVYDEEGSFSEERFCTLIEERGWAAGWPRTPTGRYALDQKTFGKRCRRHPELKPLQQLRDQIAELRLGAFVNTVGVDDGARIPLLPFWTATGRCQPSGRDKAFLLSLPSWVHGLIKPREGYGIACIDWIAQEIAIAAGLSGDPVLIKDYMAGDIHLQFAIRSGLAPASATKKSHREIRDLVKPVSLGVGFGMTKYGISAQTGKSLLWSSETLARYRAAYPVCTKWRHDRVAQAIFDEKISSPLRWPMHVHRGTRQRTLLNFMQQATGADCMRAAAIAGHAAGIEILVPMHDAFWITAPLGELDDAIATMRDLMTRVGEAICGIPIATEVSEEVHWPNCLGDTRADNAKGQALWTEIRNLVTGGLLRRTG